MMVEGIGASRISGRDESGMHRSSQPTFCVYNMLHTGPIGTSYYYYNYARQVNPCAGFDHTTIGSGLGKKESYGLGWDPCEGSDCKKSDQ